MAHTVLVVDDDPSLRDAVERALRLGGSEVRLAGDGLGALREIEAEDQDVVLLDIDLPRLDGLAVCRRLRADGRRTVLMLTARDGWPTGSRGWTPGLTTTWSSRSPSTSFSPGCAR